MPCWLASFSHEIARASNSAVKRLEASAQGSRTTRGPVLGAVAARRPGVQDRAVLTGVEVTPAMASRGLYFARVSRAPINAFCSDPSMSILIKSTRSRLSSPTRLSMVVRGTLIADGSSDVKDR